MSVCFLVFSAVVGAVFALYRLDCFFFSLFLVFVRFACARKCLRSECVPAMNSVCALASLSARICC